MSTFSDELTFSEITGTSPKLYRTENAFTFFYNDDKTGEYVYIPAGTVFNGASIPNIFQFLFNWNPIDPRWVQASVIHDCLVGEWGGKFHVTNNETKRSRLLSWAESAKWFDKALKIKTVQHNCQNRYRRVFVLAVRLFGIIMRA